MENFNLRTRTTSNLAPAGLALAVCLCLFLFITQGQQIEARAFSPDPHRWTIHPSADARVPSSPLASSSSSLPAARTAINSILKRNDLNTHQWYTYEPKVVHETDKVLLLTNGDQIKLYPLHSASLIPSGGYYVIESREFNLSDSRLLGPLGPDSKFTKWLRYKQNIIKLKSNGNLDTAMDEPSSILPQQDSWRHPSKGAKRQQRLKDSQLYISNQTGWKKPLISDVGYMFDSRFCKVLDNNSRVQKNNCLVIFWLDKRNKYLRYGSHKFSVDLDGIKLLSSQFNATGNLRSLSDDNTKTLWLREFPPVDLCEQANKLDSQMEECQVFSMAVNPFDGGLHVQLGPVTSDDEMLDMRRRPTRIMSTSLPRGQVTVDPYDLQLSFQSIVQFDEFGGEKSSGHPRFNMKNMINIKARQTHLFYLNQHQDGKIKSIELSKYLAGGRHISSLPPVAEPKLVADITSEIKSQFIQKEGPQVITKEIPAALAMTASSFTCRLYWLNEKYDLYSSNLAGRNVQFLERLSLKPSLRLLDEMHSYKDVLFFSNLATNSIMSYNITRRAEIVRQEKIAVNLTNKKRFDSIQRWEPTHQVLLVEPSTIQSFSVVDLDEDHSGVESSCKLEQMIKHKKPGRSLLESISVMLTAPGEHGDIKLEARVVDDDLTEHIRVEKLDEGYQQALLEDTMYLFVFFVLVFLVVCIISRQASSKATQIDREAIVDQNNQDKFDWPDDPRPAACPV